jgi:lipopolysaccharide/colanic/teichoic acid biosynthesis glycosyltransferase
MAHINISAPRRWATRSRKLSAAIHTEPLASARKLAVVICLIMGDILSTLAVLALTRPISRWAEEAGQWRPPVQIGVLVVLFFCFGLYTRFEYSRYERFRRRALAIGYFIVLRIASESYSPSLRALLFVAPSLALCLAVLGHYTEGAARSFLRRFDLWGIRVAIFGGHKSSRELAAHLLRHPHSGSRLIGFIGGLDQAEEQLSESLPPLLGSLRDPSEDFDKIDAVVFASIADFREAAASEGLLRPEWRLFLMNDNFDESLPGASGASAFGIELRRNAFLARNKVAKRAIDLLLSFPLAVLATPAILALALAVKTIDPGRAFYIQKRIGRRGLPFRMFKLRTMYADSERRLEQHLNQDPQARAEWKRYFKLRHDPRILPVIGSFMRRASLDELPQLWNVVLGDMSLIGPRPFPAYHLESFDAEFRAIRQSVPPGITGSWQTSSRSDGDLSVQKKEDLFYIFNYSLSLDLYLLLETIPTVLKMNGAR